MTPEQLEDTAKRLRAMVADERKMSPTFALPEYKCELVEEAAALLEASATEARRAATTGAVEDESAIPKGDAQ